MNLKVLSWLHFTENLEINPLVSSNINLHNWVKDQPGLKWSCRDVEAKRSRLVATHQVTTPARSNINRAAFKESGSSHTPSVRNPAQVRHLVAKHRNISFMNESVHKVKQCCFSDRNPQSARIISCTQNHVKLYKNKNSSFWNPEHQILQMHTFFFDTSRSEKKMIKP